MANRVNSYLSDANVYASCPEMFPIPQQKALNMFSQPDEELRALAGVKPEKYLRTPPRPENFNIMATNLARQYQTQEGVGVAIRNLNNQFRQDIRQPVRLPGITFPPPNAPNRPNVLTQNVPVNQVLLDLAAQVRQLGGDAAQQRLVNAQQLAALQALTSQGIATQQQQAQVQAQIQNPNPITQWLDNTGKAIQGLFAPANRPQTGRPAIRRTPTSQHGGTMADREANAQALSDPDVAARALLSPGFRPTRSGGSYTGFPTTPTATPQTPQRQHQPE